MHWSNMLYRGHGEVEVQQNRRYLVRMSALSVWVWVRSLWWNTQNGSLMTHDAHLMTVQTFILYLCFCRRGTVGKVLLNERFDLVAWNMRGEAETPNWNTTQTCYSLFVLRSKPRFQLLLRISQNESECDMFAKLNGKTQEVWMK